MRRLRSSSALAAIYTTLLLVGACRSHSKQGLEDPGTSPTTPGEGNRNKTAACTPQGSDLCPDSKSPNGEDFPPSNASEASLTLHPELTAEEGSAVEVTVTCKGSKFQAVVDEKGASQTLTISGSCNPAITCEGKFLEASLEGTTSRVKMSGEAACTEAAEQLAQQIK